jgi:hypothetical protein
MKFLDMDTVLEDHGVERLEKQTELISARYVLVQSWPRVCLVIDVPKLVDICHIKSSC